MPAPLVSLSDLKTYLGLTSSDNDALLSSIASNASIIAERDTGRTFSVTSNTTRFYSTDGQASLVIHDVPFSDSSRVVTLNGAALDENSGYWMLQDRRNPAVSTTIQLRHFDRSRVDWYKASADWFDRNLDQLDRRGASPNDLKIEGVEGHPSLTLDTKQAITELGAWLYYRAKAGATGTVTLPTGEDVELSEYPPIYQRFVAHWKIVTAVSVVP